MHIGAELRISIEDQLLVHSGFRKCLAKCGAHVQVSADGGSDPRWERDSHGIVYRMPIDL
jgi:hypothetical protein